MDPAAFMDDPYMAFQLRMVLMVTSQPDEPEEEVDPFERSRARAAELMREYGG